MRELLKGAYDIHVHTGPSVANRRYDAYEALKIADSAGMAGIVLVDHVIFTAPIAQLLNGLGLRTRAFGGIMLNYPLGGLNPFAVESALKLGTKQISMPTYSAAAHIEKYGAVHPAFPYAQSPRDRGIKILDGRGRLRREVEEILDLLVGATAHLATGHLCPDEIFRLVKRAKELHVPRILVNSTSTDIVALPLDMQEELVGDGVFFEHTYLALTSTTHTLTTIERIAHEIKSVGPQNCIIASDTGQPGNPDLATALEEFIKGLITAGLTEGDIVTMIKDNPSRLLALGEGFR